MRQIGTDGCDHIPVWVGRVAVSACEDCGTVDWFSDTGPIDAAEGMAQLFGSYDLVGQIDAVRAPSPRVLVYTPSSARKRRSLAVMPANVWLRVGPDLWLSHDGETLLLATNHELLIENLTRGA
jgi:hypothetical protein